MVSIIIPSNKDHLLQKTIDSLIDNSTGEIEVIVVLDGYKTEVKQNSKVKVIYSENSEGMRASINKGLLIAKGDYIMKSDSHCLFGKGYDTILSNDCQDNWLMIPRRYSLDEVNWKRDETRPIWDYHYIVFPQDTPYGYGLFIGRLNKKNDKMIDDTMIFQGSCWFANRKYFMEHVGLMDDRIETYGSFAGDQLEIGLKYWLNGGEIKIDKNTWYAHLSKRGYHYKQDIYSRTFKKDLDTIKSHTWTTKHWINNEEPNMKYTFDWLIKKFEPIPNWSDNWQEIWNKYNIKTYDN